MPLVKTSGAGGGHGPFVVRKVVLRYPRLWEEVSEMPLLSQQSAVSSHAAASSQQRVASV